MLKTKINNELKEIHELYKKNSGGTLDYIGEAYQYINGELKHTFSAGYDTTVSGVSPLTLTNSRAKNTNWKIEGQSKQGILPDGYTQLEYIENSAVGPYFETTIQPITEKTAVEIKGYITNGNSAFGGNGNTVPYFNSTSNTATTLAFRYGSTAAAKTITDTNGKFYNTPATIKFGNQKMYLDGELKKTLSEEPFTYDYPMRIWARKAGSLDSAIGRLYFANIYNEDTLVFSGVPCKRNSDNVLGLYDTVSNSFLAPSGSGSFTAGPTLPTPTNPVDVNGCGNSGLPNGYKKLEYITTANANQALDTEYIPNSDDNFEYKGIKKIGASLFGVAGGGTYNFTGSSGTHQFRVGTNNNVVTMDASLHTVKVIDADVYIDNVKTADTIIRLTPAVSMTYSAALFGRNRATSIDDGAAGQTLYYIKFFDKLGALKFHAIPCINPDGVIGMYDLVAGKFLNRVGTDTTTPFIAGPEDTSCVVPILQANNCGMVDLGTLNWNYISGQQVFYTTISDIHPTRGLECYCKKYTNSGIKSATMEAMGDMKYQVMNNTTVYITDSHFTNASLLKASLSGIVFYYQRATDTSFIQPTITNITLPAPLQKIGTYTDSIESDGTLTRGVGVVVLDGTESWAKRSDEGVNRYQSSICIGKPSGVPNCLSSHFKNVITYSTLLDGCFLSDASDRAVFDKEDITTVEDWKSWLAAQYAAGTPVIVYYPLATPTETSVEVPTISTSKGTNYVDVNTEVKPSNVSMTYRKKTK